jgi:pimeloyl-ACP methyl ester carboxylesterase/2-polyprenyl-3-methyl-5-hydroxy-6-metoxy-1,4-benzoquinol methylase
MSSSTLPVLVEQLDATSASAADRDALAERLVTATTGALELFSIHLGRRLGLYDALAEGPASAAELAGRAGIHPRYATEWLEQQAVAGLVQVTAGADPADGPLRRYELPVAHRPVLLDAEDASHVAPLADMVAGISGVLDALPAAYRDGTGVPYAQYGRAFSQGQGGINRPLFGNDLDGWLAALPDVAQRIRQQPHARIVEVGSGDGWLSLALARAFPAATVDGYDADAASVTAARSHAAAAGLADRVHFHLVDAARPDTFRGPIDLAVVFEVLHDLAQPGEVLTALRAALAPGGVVLVADERVAAQFSAPGSDVERLMYGWSVTHCLPASMAEHGSAALGTVLRPGAVHRLAADAGFRSEELPLENDFFRFYRLDPALRATLPTGVDLGYVTHGDPGDRAAVLLHGLSDSSWSYSRVMPLLNGVFTVAVDLRGHGLSSAPEDGYQPEQMADDVVALLDHLGLGRVTVVGHSMSSVIGRVIATRHPGRVERLVLLAPVGLPVNAGARELRDAVAAFEGAVPESFVREFQASTSGPSVPEAFLERVVADSSRLVPAAWQGALTGLTTAQEVQLGDITVPTLLVWGELDGWFPRSEPEALAAGIPDATLVTLPGVGHAPHWEDPSRVAEVLTPFLQRRSSVAA